MNRRKFLRRIGVVTATTIITPHIVLTEPSIPSSTIEPIKLNEGLWHQLRRGKILDYGYNRGITKEHIREAVEYVFNNETVRQERFFRFETGELGRKLIKESMSNFV